MKKAAVRKVSVFLLLAAVLVFAGIVGSAEAARQTFGNAFSAEVPEGWNVEDESDDELVNFTFSAPDGSAKMAIMIGTNEGWDAMEIAANMANEMGGSTPVLDEDGDATFTFESDDGLNGEGFVTAGDEIFIILLGLGEGSEAEALANSLQFH